MHLRWMATLGAVAVISAVLVIGLGVFSMLRSEARAHDVLARAEGVLTSSPEIMRGFALVSRSPVFPGGSGAPTQAAPSEATTASWYDSSGRVRLETEMANREGVRVYSLVTVWDGTAAWLKVDDLISGERFVRIYPQASFPPPVAALGLFAVPADQSLTGRLRECYRERFSIWGEGLVSGRAALAVRLGPSSCSESVDADPYGRGGLGDRFVWVDRENYFILRDELRDASGAVIRESVREVLSVEYNIPLDPALFEVRVPNGIDVQDCRVTVCP